MSARLRYFTLLLFIAALSSGYADRSAADPAIISGSPGITDGDTIRIGNERIRLHGIDAPESRQNCETASGESYPCGAQATKKLAEFIGNRDVDCEVKDTDRYQRAVAVCLVDGENINAWMVKSGWAVAYRKYSMDYVADEDAAKDAKVGLWLGEFVNPWDWRKKKQ
ncbi:MAG: thermonuclease family protein [Proteobacteria bacterium]|nr:thermonuclease family protein [Pseudomonadota bacterium]